MAKDLPYFKFYSSEWNDGDITLEEMKTQGVFINVCSYYWSRECNLEQPKLTKRFRSYVAELAILIDAGVVTISRGMVKISFLDKQWSERENKKATMKANGLKGGRPKKNPKLSNEETKSFPSANQDITNKEEKREEEKRKELKSKPKKITLPEFIDRDLWEDFMEIRKKKGAVNSERALNGLIKKLEEVESFRDGQANFEIERAIESSWKSIYPSDKSMLSGKGKANFAGYSVASLNSIVEKMRAHQATTHDISIFQEASKDGFKPNE